MLRHSIKIPLSAFRHLNQRAFAPTIHAAFLSTSLYFEDNYHRGGMIDGHCHIAAEEFDEDRSAILQEAKKGGVNGIVGVSEFPGDFEKLLQVSREHSGLVYACIGVHPVQWGNKSVTLEDFSVAEHFIEQHHEEIVGIGEIGLDFTPRYINSPEDKEVQREVFRRQVQLAKRYGLPVNCHSRSAGRPVVDLLIEEGNAFDLRLDKGATSKDKRVASQKI